MAKQTSVCACGVLTRLHTTTGKMLILPGAWLSITSNDLSLPANLISFAITSHQNLHITTRASPLLIYGCVEGERQRALSRVRCLVMGCKSAKPRLPLSLPPSLSLSFSSSNQCCCAQSALGLRHSGCAGGGRRQSL